MSRRSSPAAPAGARARHERFERLGEVGFTAGARAERRAHPARAALVERARELCAELGWEMPEDRSHSAITDVIDAAIIERHARRGL